MSPVTLFNRLSSVRILLLGFFLVVSHSVSAQNYTFQTLYSFRGGGYTPNPGLIADSQGNLYGTTPGGGASYGGTIFEYSPSTGQLTTLYSFGSPIFGQTVLPNGGLCMDSQGNLYGSTAQGGGGLANTEQNSGSLYKFTPSSGQMTTLYSFSSFIGSSSGALPNGGLIVDSSGNLYGTANPATTNSQGIIFEYNASTGELITLGQLSALNASGPNPGLLRDSSGNLYGTASQGGANGNGVIFEYVASSGQLTTLASLPAGTASGSPNGGLIADNSGALYGTTGGVNGDGTIFEYAPSTGKLSTLHTFTGGAGGANPGPLIADSQGNLYGVTSTGGSSGQGILFKYAPATGQFTPIVSFNGANGSAPVGALIANGQGVFYGTASAGGSANGGALFAFNASSAQLSAAYSFVNAGDASYPTSGLILGQDGALYGSASGGGVSNAGAIFRFDRSTMQVSTLASFDATTGISPNGCLLADSQGNFYGVTEYGGFGLGGLFKYAYANNQLTALGSLSEPGVIFGPNGSLVADSQGNLYGTSILGGSNQFSEGNIFQYSSSTGQITTLFNFPSGASGVEPNGGLVADSQGNLYGLTNLSLFEYVPSTGQLTTLYTFASNEGLQFASPLLLDGAGNLYGTTQFGSSEGYGLLFKYSLSTGQLTTLYTFNIFTNYPTTSPLFLDPEGNLYVITTLDLILNNAGGILKYNLATGQVKFIYLFNGGADGKIPIGALFMDEDGNLFGTTQQGGAYGQGTIFFLHPSTIYVPSPGGPIVRPPSSPSRPVKGPVIVAPTP